MLVKEAMKKDVKTIRPSDTIKDAAVLMNKNRIGSLVVVSGTGTVTGIVTERDILIDVVATGKNAEDVKVEDIMTKELITISPDKSLEDAADVMTKNKIKKLPVMEGGRLVGIITATDLICYEKKLIEKISNIMLVSPFKRIGG